MTLLVATTNPGKLREIRLVLESIPCRLLSLADLPPVAEPEETGSTFWENARLKALAYAGATGLTVVAEDSGLEIDALGGAPGVQSARFLGRAATYEARFAAIYRQLHGRPGGPFAARFVAALAVAAGDAILFETEASVDGIIAPSPSGANGFGYDPIFWYPPLGRTTGDMTPAEKVTISHRGRALRDLRRALRRGL